MNKNLTLAAYKRGEGTRDERAQFGRIFSNAMLRLKDHVNDVLVTADALKQATGVDIDYGDGGDDLQTVIDRVKDYPCAKSVLDMATTLRALRQRGHEQREASAEHGAQGGKKAAKGNKKPNGLTHTQDDRKTRFEKLTGDGTDCGRALAMIARKDGCSLQAVRQSLKAAGVHVIKKNSPGRQRI